MIDRDQLMIEDMTNRVFLTPIQRYGSVTSLFCIIYVLFCTYLHILLLYLWAGSYLGRQAGPCYIMFLFFSDCIVLKVSVFISQHCYQTLYETNAHTQTHGHKCTRFTTFWTNQHKTMRHPWLKCHCSVMNIKGSLNVFFQYCKTNRHLIHLHTSIQEQSTEIGSICTQ